ncbi:hypothetical protein BU24DRAFT_428866 [Aaosphaeria arxii CBS 175.79]|uniref:Uncharacterized protein n=1 Tax=Aaosphaeria arxii CBS 175.79 TaxID=1450172 RepID=A0A6A5X8W1_9PLEO|nr:uncharacterized protein BU24DRAFT_428866 [Aaosphaeria arxii CBS 175.79]KAF2009329.1 hypothetical protein BU24DRAFT_428866 [Aaosphaeria arxii CBS 175.79]
MGFKRKRSTLDDSPLSMSSFASLNTPEAQSPTPIPHALHSIMDIDPQSQPYTDPAARFGPVKDWFAHAQRVKASDLGCRTRKRFRDNRPDERTIHEITMNKLFCAQRNLPNASPIPSLPQYPGVETQSVPVQKSTLHSFWKISAPPVQPTQSPPVHVQQHHEATLQAWDTPRCEDCDSVLQAADGMSVDIDMDSDAHGCQFACNECGRKICASCAVVSNHRHCLQCATAGREGRW